MITRIEVSSEDFKRVDVYTINKKLSPTQQKKIAAALADPVIQKGVINKPLAPKKFSWAVEIGYLPGVTDNIGHTAGELIADLLKIQFKQDEGVYSSKVLFFDKKPNVEELYNPLIQRVALKNFSQFKKERGMDKIVPQVQLGTRIKVNEVNLNVSDPELVEISQQGTLALDLLYLRTIQKYFKKLGRNPTDIELESIAQTWSEHCKHTIFADPIDEIKEGLFKKYIRGATERIKSPLCVSVFTDNSGVIRFDKNYNITHKVETHNSPSALDPFGGSITGIVGVNRDTIGTGVGAKPVINFYGFCLADPKDQTKLFRDSGRTQKMLSARRIMDGVIEGVNAGGNQSGIPTPQGFLYFHPRYRGKPLVFAGTVGLMPKKVNGKPSHLKKAKAGDLIVMIGNRAGLDGIHGATFSSVALDSKSPAAAVQIGDPITQKKLSDAVIKEARDMGLYNSITDNGAGGLSCSVAEMAKESGGCLVDLEKVPLKYPGLAPWQIWISESQERMTLAVPPRRWNKFKKLMARRGVEATVIGKFTGSGRCTVRYKNEKIMDLEMEFLHNGLPQRHLKTKKPSKSYIRSSQNKNFNSSLLINLLQNLNVTSWEFISRQYDHEVQAGSVLKPLQGRGKVNGDVSIVRPVLSSNSAVALSQALYPELTEADPYKAAALTIDQAVRNLVVVGVPLEKIALLDNFCWCSSNEPERLWQLKETARACYDTAVYYGTPFISGKDSMFNDFKGFDKRGRPLKISVPPTLLISSIGVIDDLSKAVSLDFKIPGDLIYVVGDARSLKNKDIYKVYGKCIEERIITSAQTVSRGGVLVALARSAMGGMFGVDATLPKTEGLIVVSVAPQNKTSFEKLMKKYAKFIGKVRNDTKFIINNGKDKVIKTTVNILLKHYKLTFKDF